VRIGVLNLGRHLVGARLTAGSANRTLKIGTTRHRGLRRHMEAKQTDQAIQKLRESATDAATDPADRRAAAELLAEAGAVADAVPALILAGRDLMDAGDVEEARACFVRAFALDPKNYDALFEVGRADLAEGHREDALAKFVEVLRKTNLRHLPALFETGCLYEGLGKFDEAILAFKRIVERDKTHMEGLEHLGRVHQAKNLKPDAVHYYNLAADAAFDAERFADAKRCNNAALALDVDNAKAKAMQAALKNLGGEEAAKPAPKAQEKTAAAAPKAAPPHVAMAPPATPANPVAAPAPQAAPTPAPAPQAAPTPAPRPAPAPAPVPAAAAPPAPASVAAPHIVPNPLTAEVFLLEQQSEAMSRLAQAQSEVAQTYKKRLAMEEEIKTAKAALEALEADRASVESSLRELESSVAAAAKAKAAEDSALAQLSTNIQQVREELDALSSLPTDIESIKAKCGVVSAQIAKANEVLAASQARADKVVAEAGAVETTVKDLQSKFAAARQGADAVENQLVGLLEQTRGAHAAAKGAVGQVADMKAAIAALETLSAQLDTARVQLEAESKRIESKQADTAAALQRVEAIRASRGAETSNGAATAATNSAAAAASSAAGAAAKKTNGVARGPAATDVSALIAEGDALRSARNAAGAREKYKAAIALDPANSGARYRLGLALSDLGKSEDALTMLRPLGVDKEYGVLAQTAVAEVLRARGELDGAEAQLSKALEATGYPEEHYRHALYSLAGLHESKGDADSLGLALWSYEEILAGDPAYADVAKRVEKIKAALATPSARNGAK
jgi:tetratricopeptide (TPR) repeat protein